MNSQYIFERTEMKYIITEQQKQQLFALISDHLVDDLYPHSEISSIYLDSDDFRLIRNAYGCKDYKEKLRIRCYGAVNDDSTVFMEIKKK